MKLMAPMMAMMMDVAYTGVMQSLACPENADRLATFMRNYRDAPRG